MKIQHVFRDGQHRSAIAPVVDEMRKRGHEVVEVSVCSKDVNERKQGYENVDVENSDIFLCSYPHIIRNADGAYNKAYGIKICIEHGVNPVAWAFPLDRHVLFDYVFLAGKWQQEAIARSSYSKVLPQKSILTGWPKADALNGYAGNKELREEKRIKLCEKLHLDKTKPIISFVPTHGAAWFRADELAKMEIPNLVIAPHNAKYAEFHGKSDSRLRINYAKDYPHYIETDDIYEVLIPSDIVISDYSSAMLEALILDIPIIQLLVPTKLHRRELLDPWDIGFYPLSQFDNRTFQVGPNIREIRDVPIEIEKALKDPKNFWAGERAYWRDEIFANIGSATKICCDTIEMLYAKKM